MASTRYDPGSQLRFVEASGERPRLGPPNTTQRHTKNTGDYDVTVRFNADGLRDSKDLARGGAKALYVVGDSFAFGWGVEEDERFSDVLQRLTGEPVYNLAVPSSDLLDCERLIAYAERRGAKIHRLVVALCMENDLGNYPPPGALPPRRRQPSSLKATLARHSAVYALLTHAVHSYEASRNAAIRLGLIVPNLAGAPLQGYAPEGLRSVQARLVALAERGFDVTILILPSRRLWTSESGDTAKTHETLVGWLRESGLKVVDPRSRFEATGDPLGVCHFARDGHWTPLAHDLAARELARR